MDVLSLVEGINARGAAREHGVALIRGMREYLEPLRELHRGRTKKERRDWAQAALGFVDAAEKAHQAERLAEALRQFDKLAASPTHESISAAVLSQAAQAMPLAELCKQLDGLPAQDAASVRLAAYRLAVGFVNNCFPECCVDVGAVPKVDPPGAQVERNRLVVLRILNGAGSSLLTNAEIEDRTGANGISALSERTIGGVITAMIRDGLAHRDCGPKKGAGLTPAGKKFAARHLADNCV